MQDYFRSYNIAKPYLKEESLHGSYLETVSFPMQAHSVDKEGSEFSDQVLTKSIKTKKRKLSQTILPQYGTYSNQIKTSKSGIIGSTLEQGLTINSTFGKKDTKQCFKKNEWIDFSLVNRFSYRCN